MRGKPVGSEDIKKIIALRQKGYSLPEICREIERGGSTVYKYAKMVKVLPEYEKILKQKRGGSIDKAKKQWAESYDNAKQLLGKITEKEKFFILASIYWGEGTKKELNLINSDPKLIKVFISCLESIGVGKKDLRISIRLYKGVEIEKAKKYWANVCGIAKKQIMSVNVIQGKKENKLPCGMCRVRVSKGAKFFKLIMSMIQVIKSAI